MLSSYLKTLRNKIRNNDIVDIEEVEHEINELIGSAMFYEDKYKNAKVEIEHLKNRLNVAERELEESKKSSIKSNIILFLMFLVLLIDNMFF